MSMHLSRGRNGPRDDSSGYSNSPGDVDLIGRFSRPAGLIARVVPEVSRRGRRKPYRPLSLCASIRQAEPQRRESKDSSELVTACHLPFDDGAVAEVSERGS